MVSWKEAAERKLSVAKGLSYAQRDRAGHRRFAAFLFHPPVFIFQFEIHQAAEEKRYHQVLTLRLHQHLPDDNLDMLIINLHALGTVDLLDLLTRYIWTPLIPLIFRISWGLANLP